MSDTQQGPGWWQASDGKWYPPEQMASAGLSPAGPTPPKPWWKRWWVIAMGIFLLIVVIGAAAGGSEDGGDTEIATDATTTSAPAEESTTAPGAEPAAGVPAPTAAPTIAAPATAAPRTTLPPATTPPTTANEFGSGKKEIGRDIQPGLYRTRKASSGCYWARLSGLGGGFEDVIANDNANGPAVVEIMAADKGFESTRCATWTKDVSAITANRTSFGEGTFIVGTDMEPGTYRNSGDGTCYWARLKNFEGGLNGVITNENTEGTTIVEIQPDDRGFVSSRCGTWTKS